MGTARGRPYRFEGEGGGGIADESVKVFTAVGGRDWRGGSVFVTSSMFRFRLVDMPVGAWRVSGMGPGQNERWKSILPGLCGREAGREFNES